MPNRAGEIIRNIPERARRATALALIGAATLSAAGCKDGAEKNHNNSVNPAPTAAERAAISSAKQNLKNQSLMISRAIVKRMSEVGSNVVPTGENVQDNIATTKTPDNRYDPLNISSPYYRVPQFIAEKIPSFNRVSITQIGVLGNSTGDERQVRTEIVYSLRPNNTLLKHNGQLTLKELEKGLKNDSTNLVAVTALPYTLDQKRFTDGMSGVWFDDSGVYDNPLAAEDARDHKNPVLEDYRSGDEAVRVINRASQDLGSAYNSLNLAAVPRQ